MNRVAAALVVIALAACEHKPLTFARRQLPGMSIELPVIKSSEEQLEYRAGKVILNDDVGGQVIVRVEWGPGKLTGDEQQMLLSAGAFKDPTERVPAIRGPNGQSVDTTQIATKGHPILVSVVQCGGRAVRIASSSPRGGRALQERIVGSLLCTPDPREEERLNAATIPLGLSLPGWYTLSRDGGVLRIGDADSSLEIAPIPTGITDETIQALAPVIRQAYKGAMRVTAGGVGRVVVAGTVDGVAVVGWARIIKCPTSVLLVSELSRTQAHADAVEAAVAAARCLGRIEPGPSWPDAPAGASH
jgi:hypothetical protein